MAALNVPVLLIIFNRPETTARVLETIRAAAPAQLFIAADGPRADVPDDRERCEAARQVATAVDWQCDVHTLFRKENRGCGRGPAEAIDWFFDNVDCGIVLEDDCVPCPSFFRFCEALLMHYRDHPQVMHISGNNFQFGKRHGRASYYFSAYSHNWGWATWKRAWSRYRFELRDFDPAADAKVVAKYVRRKVERDYWLRTFEELRMGKHDVWDAQWQYCVWKSGGVSVLPNVNLVTNVGFGEDATHTFRTDHVQAYLKTEELGELRHRRGTRINRKADRRSFDRIYVIPLPRKTVIKNRLRSILMHYDIVWTLFCRARRLLHGVQGRLKS